MEDVKCSVCGEDATRYIGNSAVLPICDNVVCYHTRIEEVNKLVGEMNKGKGVANVSYDFI